ncbi:GPI mannosyltransferase 3 [Lecanosticta acicola]|uniref:Mannosyltransferase n=1 Tax=Lecanosticta acicola TaxID=111012 RepID=A0AAI8YYL1_9PEZI|nr:GPI mannosyltransferase 3 [Lecanosticta acicola]
MPPKTSRHAQSDQPVDLRLQLIVFQFVLFPLRVIASLYVQTFFQPDEYFQALEPAWQIAFGIQSGAWLTWEWKEGLRTSFHPYLFAGLYKIVDIICSALNTSAATRASALVIAPRILQAFVAAQLDLAVWKISARSYGNGSPASWAALGLIVFSPWHWFCGIRTFSNSLEATMTAIGLRFFPWQWFLEPDKSDKTPLSLESFNNVSWDWNYLRYLWDAAPDQLFPALAFAALSTYLRPTNIIIWITISAGIIGCNRNYRKASILVQSAAYVGSVVVAILASLDYLYYGNWTFPPLRFLYFNVVQSLAVFYGTNRICYYFTEGLPLLLTTALPFAIVGIWKSLQSGQAANPSDYVKRQTRFIFALAIVVSVVTLSTIGHKEVRFIYPLLPMLLVLAAGPLADFFHPFPAPKSVFRKFLLAMMVTTNIYIAGYLSSTHQRGVVDVVHYLRHRQEAWLETVLADAAGTSNITVGFLMPCHSTPWRSHLVYHEIDAWALTCEPPLNMTTEERASYLDEADIFYANPTAWLEQNMMDQETVSRGVDLRELAEKDTGRREWPHHLVFFQQLEPTMKTVLAESRYKECRRFFNSHWHEDWRRKGDVVVWCFPR